MSRPDSTTLSAMERSLREIPWVLGRSLYPFAALGLLAGTLVWGPWVTLILTAIWWKFVTRFA